ncbi:(Fe-S)-binding protein [Oceanidesulfovibrio indonesiensis]|uniref:(Fe-S)-binding protein n=1 Tax=Oceanidesulfovibrio indonesiensis TaxID=54767 RepID=A0A7M3MG33_9BACT|nr:(Fe-S)-binding protein [Oceanidesulfovibrio indonesiensis]TVM18278.1 (Fe-S)-binding protein [Oceanidesulfovibrio indonesiensis]
MSTSNGLASDLPTELDTIREMCTACGACVKHCPFLRRYGDPFTIAGRLESGSLGLPIAFECSLCGLCASVCPYGVEPTRMFLAMRRSAVEQNAVNMKPYRRLLSYEARGHSRLFAHYAIPEGCETVLFPGCTLPGTRPAAMAALTARLRELIPNLGVALDCCHKPSHDLGRQEFFERRFNAIRDKLAAAGVTTLLTACPNCTKTFRAYGDGLEARTVYEVLAEAEGPPPERSPIEVMIHDPCPFRNDESVREASRKLLTARRLSVVEPAQTGRRTLCCGEGGSVGCIDAALADVWTNTRLEQAEGLPVAASCAGCAAMLRRAGGEAHHALDLYFHPAEALSGTIKPSGFLAGYRNRLRYKRAIRKSIR